MAHFIGSELEELVKTKVENELANITSSTDGRESRNVSKTIKDAVAVMLPSLASIISVAVSVFCHRKKINEIMQNNKKKKNQR